MKNAGHKLGRAERLGPAGEKLSRCERAVSGRAPDREAEPACRFGPRARISKTKSPDVRAKNIIAWYKAKWAEGVESAGEKLSCRGRAVLGRALG